MDEKIVEVKVDLKDFQQLEALRNEWALENISDVIRKILKELFDS